MKRISLILIVGIIMLVIPKVNATSGRPHKQGVIKGAGRKQVL